MHSIIIMTTLFNNHLYISSSKSHGYVEMVVEYDMECISLCAWHFLFVYFVIQCIHSAIPTSARFLFEIF